MSLAYLPPNRVVYYYNLVCAQFQTDWPEFYAHAELVEFLEYLERQWLSGNVVDIADWNVYNDDKEHTNNHVEGWHNKFHQAMGDHPNIWRAIEVMQDEEDSFDRDLAQLVAGHTLVSENTWYKRLHTRIANLKKQYRNGDIRGIEYLTSLATIRNRDQEEGVAEIDDEDDADEDGDDDE